MSKTKLTCENPHHPFKQKWYWYDKDFMGASSSPHFCSSCAVHIEMIKSMLTVVLMPRETLYGDKMIKTDPNQIFEIAKYLVETSDGLL